MVENNSLLKDAEHHLLFAKQYLFHMGYGYNVSLLIFSKMSEFSIQNFI